MVRVVVKRLKLFELTKAHLGAPDGGSQPELVFLAVVQLQQVIYSAEQSLFKQESNNKSQPGLVVPNSGLRVGREWKRFV